MDERYRVRIEGTRPLLMCNPASQSQDRRSKANPTPEDEAKAKLYLDGAGKLAQPATHLEGSMFIGSKKLRMKGRATYASIFKAGVFVEPELIPHETQSWVIDTRGVKIRATGGRILRSRPRLDSWALSFSIRVTDVLLNGPILKEALDEAGNHVGIGDYRPRYGLFTVTHFEKEGVTAPRSG
jgi:hypothetical protein